MAAAPAEQAAPTTSACADGPAPTPAPGPGRGVLLLVEDDPDHAFLVRRQLAASWALELDVEQLTTAGDAERRLAQGGVACVVADLSLPDATGLDVLLRLQAVSPEVPVVVLTGLDSDEVGLAALQAGAQDYLVKGRHDAAALGRAVLFALERAQRQRAEHRQDELAQQLHLLLEASAEGICWLDPDGVCTFVNRAAAELFGWDAAALTGQQLHDSVHLCSEQPCVLASALRGTVRVDAGEQRFRRKDSSELLAEVRVRPVAGGPGQGLVVNVTDITARRQAQTSLAEREAQLVQAQRLARLGSWEWDTFGDEVRWSQELHRITGLSAAELPSDRRAFDHYLALVPEPYRAAAAALFCTDADGAPRTQMLRHPLVRADGGVRWVACHVSSQTPSGVGLRLIGSVQDVTEQKTAEDALEHLALHDPLTGLPNRALLLDRLRHALDGALRTDGRVGIVFLDLDRFKWVNDSLSHAAGDRLLVSVAERLSTVLRPSDTLARLGGDEFVIVCDRVDSEQAVLQLVQRITGALQPAFDLDGSPTHVSASMGVAVSSRRNRSDAEALLRDADTAMYRAKERGRARYEFFDEPMRRRASQRLETQNDLHSAVANGEIVVLYQPVVDLASGAVVGTEALARWQHPTRGLLLPDAFIPHAEESGLIVALGAAVLREACAQTARWNARRGEDADLEVAVNLSARQLSAPGLVDEVRRALDDACLPASLLCLEITESVVMQDVATSGAVLGRLRALGVRIAVDDFGTGYSSLSYLRTLPVDLLKVDRSFVSALGDTGPGTAIVGAVSALASALHLRVVAEGVETFGQLAELVPLGVQYAQGYLYGRPVRADEASWAAAHQQLRPGANGAPVPRARSAALPCGGQPEPAGGPSDRRL